MQKLQQILKVPYYFQWLILFFVLHQYTEFMGFIRISSMLLLIVELSAAAWILFFLFRKMYRDAHKAALLVSVLFFCYFFFGAIQDALAGYRPLFKWSLFPRLLPVMLLVCAGTFIGLFRYKRSPVKLTRFLSGVFVTLMLFDTCLILWQAATVKQPKAPMAAESIKPLADTAAKPDVYLILLDEYLGSSGLQEYYHYDNSVFESFLRQKGFHINTSSRGNYHATIYAMASMLNMRYLDTTEVGHSPGFIYKNMIRLIDRNAVVEYFKRFNYSIHNYSPFVVGGIDPKYHFSMVPWDIELITFRMLYARTVGRIIYAEPQDYIDLSPVTTWFNKKLAAIYEKQMQGVLDSAGRQSPAFTYLHLLMPHKPFIFDSTGKFANTYKAVKGHKQSGIDKLYLQYLVYTNKRLMKYLDQLFAATQGKAVIMVMSDHGNRDAVAMPDKFFGFTNFNAIYLPNKDYHLWYDSVSNVNQFPLLFNTLFGQQIPLKKDSSVY
ncbi:MAG: sulfatase-like hydrolase/transferase [Niastella sp.]|uniref:sulfatase-like hydrolase/transferase n=1 Tax=Niastella sp. TaxID=1869183 RepID=UPI00389AEC50